MIFEETIVIGAHLDTWDISPGPLTILPGRFRIGHCRTFRALGLKTRRTIDFVLLWRKKKAITVPGMSGKPVTEPFTGSATCSTTTWPLTHTVLTLWDGMNLKIFQRNWRIDSIDTSFSNTIAHFTHLGSDHVLYIWRNIHFYTIVPILDFHSYHNSRYPWFNNTPDVGKNVKVSAMILYAWPMQAGSRPLCSPGNKPDNTSLTTIFRNHWWYPAIGFGIDILLYFFTVMKRFYFLTALAFPCSVPSCASWQYWRFCTGIFCWRTQHLGFYYWRCRVYLMNWIIDQEDPTVSTLSDFLKGYTKEIRGVAISYREP